MDSTAVEADLRQLLWERDPIGVANYAPNNEFDCMIEPLLGRLTAGATRSAIGEFLRQEIRLHFETEPVDEDIDAVAERIVAWWAACALEVADPDAPTACPACGAGPDQATDPKHPLRSVCYCGHPRHYDHKHRDGTCPCLAVR